MCEVRTKDFGSKSGDIIEPVLKPQWWVSCQPLAEEAIKVRLGSLLVYWPSHICCLFSAQGRASWSLHPNSRRMTGIDGSKGSRTGVSPDSCGGVIGVLPILLISRAGSKMQVLDSIPAVLFWY
jgi:hypothetical protein